MARRDKWVNLRTRVPAEVGDAIKAMATKEHPPYRVLRDIVVAHVAGTTQSVFTLETVAQLCATAKTVGYPSADALVQDLAAAFLRVWRYQQGVLDDDEPTPDEEIRSMFGEIYEVEKGRGICKSP